MKLGALMLLVTLSISGDYVAAGQSERIILATDVKALTTSEVERYTDEAIAGSAEAASTLMDYYQYGKKDAKKARFWAFVGAENGDAMSQFVAYQFLRPSPDLLEQKRSIFWLRKAADGGFLGARALLKTCNSPSSKYDDKERTPCFGPDSED
jgi:TPR repeat protein